MDEFNSFVINTHQIFLGLLCCVFSFFIYRDIDEIKEKLSVDKRVFLMLILIPLFFGLTYNFYQSWNDEGMFFAFEFALLIL